MSTQSIDAIVDRGLEAVEKEDLETAQQLLEESTKLGGENHVRVLHLTGMLAWAEGRPEHAAGYLMQAADAGSEDPNIYLDCAECLLLHDQDLDQAEAAARTVLRLTGAGQDAQDQARLPLSQIRLADDDTDEALEMLDGISDARKQDPVYLSTYGFVLMNAGRDEEDVRALKAAVEADPEDPDVALLARPGARVRRLTSRPPATRCCACSSSTRQESQREAGRDLPDRQVRRWLADPDRN